MASDANQRIGFVFAMIAVIVLLVITVTALAVYRPEALEGQRAPQTLANYKPDTARHFPFAQMEGTIDDKYSSQPNISGAWDGYSPDASGGIEEKLSILKIEQTGSFIRAFLDRRTSTGTAASTIGSILSGSARPFFEDTAGRGFIIDSIVLHLSITYEEAPSSRQL